MADSLSPLVVIFITFIAFMLVIMTIIIFIGWCGKVNDGCTAWCRTKEVITLSCTIPYHTCIIFELTDTMWLSMIIATRTNTSAMQTMLCSHDMIMPYRYIRSPYELRIRDFAMCAPFNNNTIFIYNCKPIQTPATWTTRMRPHAVVFDRSLPCLI